MDDDHKWPFPSERKAAENAAAEVLARRLEVAERMAQALRDLQLRHESLYRLYAKRVYTTDPTSDIELSLAGSTIALAEWEALK